MECLETGVVLTLSTWLLGSLVSRIGGAYSNSVLCCVRRVLLSSTELRILNGHIVIPLSSIILLA